MIVCYFGFYNPEYSRNRILIKGLRQNGIEIIECNSRLRGIAKYLELAKKHFKIRKNYDAVIVGFPGYQAVILAKFLTRKKIIFDAFTSIYDSMVWDRQLAHPRGLRAGYYWLLDWVSCKLADKILLDTMANIDYFVKTFRLKPEKFRRIFVGSDDEAIYPLAKKEKRNYFLVHFHGSFIPLQGIEYIIKAAKILEKENVMFNIIGSKIKKKYKNLKSININFVENVPYKKLKDYLAEADLCLGIFGDTPKVARVIPNKVFEALAAKRPVITGESHAIKEILSDRKNVLLCGIADARDLADKIMELKSNPELREKIAENGYNLFKEKLTPKQAVELLLDIL